MSDGSSTRDLDTVSERDAFIIQKTKEGWPCREIAEHLEITGSRVSQIQKEYGVEPTEKKPSPKYSNQDITSNLRAYYEEKGHAPTVSSWDRKPSVATIRRRFGGWKQALIAAGIGDKYGYTKKGVEQKDKYTKDGLIDQLKKAKEEFDYPSYEKVDKSDEYACGMTFIKHFGSYSNALREAGIEPYPASGGAEKEFADDEMIEKMVEAVKQEGSLITIDQWDNKYAPPTSQTYRHRFGNWTAVCNMALSRLSQGGFR